MATRGFLEYQESSLVRGDPDWMFDLADVLNATVYYSTLGFIDPGLPVEAWGRRKLGSSWSSAMGLTAARVMWMFLPLAFIADPADKHRWGLDELPWWQDNVEIYYEPIMSAPGDFWDWLGVESGTGILG